MQSFINEAPGPLIYFWTILVDHEFDMKYGIAQKQQHFYLEALRFPFTVMDASFQFGPVDISS